MTRVLRVQGRSVRTRRPRELTFSVKADSMDEGSAALESSTCSLSGLRFSFRFSDMEGVLGRRGKARKDHNSRSQHKTSTPPLPRFWSWKLAGPQIRLRLSASQERAGIDIKKRGRHPARPWQPRS